jgi:hypothetical protein
VTKQQRLMVDDPYATDPKPTTEEVSRWFTEVLPARPGQTAHTWGPIRVQIPSRVHDRDLTAEIILGQTLGFQHLKLPMDYDPDHPIGRDRPNKMTISWEFYYRLRSPASRVGPDGNFSGPTRAKRYRTRRSRRNISP